MPIERLRPQIGTVLGVSDWLEVTQDRIDRFTRATDDHQWIHIDPVRAAVGPFGATIAQGYLTMSLMPSLMAQIPLELEPSPALTVNYGLDRLRFPAPITVGSKIRARVTLIDATGVESGVQVIRRVEVEIEGGDKPGMVADTVTRLLFS